MYLTKGKNGFTFVKIMVSLTIGVLVLAAVFSLFLYGNKVFGKGSEKASVQDSVRLAMMNVEKTISYATTAEILSTSDAHKEISDLKMIDLEHNNYLIIEGGSVKIYLYTASPEGYTVQEYKGDFTETGSSFEKVNDVTVRINLQSQAAASTYDLDSELVLKNLERADPVRRIGGTSGKAIRYTVSAIPAL